LDRRGQIGYKTGAEAGWMQMGIGNKLYILMENGVMMHQLYDAEIGLDGGWIDELFD
jgi:hypothetical protein